MSEDSDSSSDEDEDEEEAIPTGMTQMDYEKLIALRARRIEQEEILNDFQKSIDILKKESDSLINKEKNIDNGLQQIEQEIEKFQQLKQGQLNELQSVVMLKLNQIQCLINKRLPDVKDEEELRNVIVFTENGEARLIQRIDDLEVEKEDLKKFRSAIKRKRGKLVAEKKTKQKEIEQARLEEYELQLLKFGRTVDLEMLENSSQDTVAEELQKIIQEEESESQKILNDWQAQLNAKKNDFKEATKANTALLRSLSKSNEQKVKIEQELNNAQKTAVARVRNRFEKGQEEKHRLRQISKLQQKEIESLKNEITILRSKGGRVYT